MSDREVAGQIATNIERMNVAYLKAWLQSQVGCDCDDGVRISIKDRGLMDSFVEPCDRCVLVEVGGIRVRVKQNFYEGSGSHIDGIIIPAVPAVEVADECLPARDKMLPSGRHRYREKIDVYNAWLRGDLKARDEMDIEAAAKTSGLWAPRLEEFAMTYAERVVDSAWGKKVGR